MKILGRTQPLAERHTIDTALSQIERLGFDGAEICLENPDIAPDQLDVALIAKIRLLVEDLGLAPVSVSYHADYVYDDDELARTLRAIGHTPEFGAEVFVFGGATRRAGDRAEWQRMVDRTGQLVEAAERVGVVLAKEFEPGFIVGCTEDMLTLLQAIPSRHLAANLDLGHAFLCDEEPIASIRRLGGKIVHGHVEDMKAGVHDHLLPGEGDMPLAAMLRALQDVGFTGGLALDLYGYDYEQVAPAALRHLRALTAA